MSKKFIYLIVLLLFDGKAMAQDDCRNQFSKDSISTVSLKTLGDAYQEMKKIDDPCIRKWNSDMHWITAELGKRLGKPGTTRTEIIKWMGIPDYEGNHIEVLKIADHTTIMVYHWRGWHDWLYFILEDDRVQYFDWWMAYE